MADAPRVAVIGGGYAGMAAAVELASLNIQVTVFEAAQQLGGRARRVEYRGAVLDNGLHILLGAYRETLRLIQLVHPAPHAALLRLPLAWHMHGEFRLAAPRLPAPLHLLVAVLGARGINGSERLAAIRMLRALRKCGYFMQHDITVELMLTQHHQSDRLKRVLWHPLCLAALNTAPERASAQVFINVLRDSLDASRDASDLLLARTDLSALFPEPAAAYVRRHGGEVATGQRVTAIDPLERGFAVTAGARRDTYSHVICALPAHQVCAFLIGITALSELADTIARLRYQPIHSVWLQYRASVVLPAPMLGFTGQLTHWVFDREVLCGQRGLIGAVISAAGNHEDLTLEALGLEVHRELKSHFPALPAPLWQRVIAEKRATFACTPGVQRPPQVTPLRNFYLAGDYTASDYPATIEAAVRSGIACARHIRSQTITAGG